MARAHTKCASCGDLLWFRDIDPVPQDVLCKCLKTELTEDGAAGDHQALTAEEIAYIEALPN